MPWLLRLGDVYVGLLFLCMFKTVLSKTHRNNLERERERVGAGEHALKQQPPPTEPSGHHHDRDSDPDSGGLPLHSPCSVSEHSSLSCGGNPSQ